MVDRGEGEERWDHNGQKTKKDWCSLLLYTSHLQMPQNGQLVLSGGYNKVHGYLMYTVLYTICAKYLRNITIILFTRNLQTTHKNYVKIHISTVKLYITIIIMLFFSQQNSTLKVNLIPNTLRNIIVLFMQIID